MSSITCFHASNGSLVRKGRTSVAPPAPPSRPTGTGYVAWESLFTAGDTIRTVLAKVRNGDILTLPAGTFEFSDFNDQGSTAGLLLPSACSGLWGTGPGNDGNPATILRMAAGSSTKASQVPTAAGTTNSFRLVETKNNNSVFAYLQVQGTNQGHYYNGLSVFGSSSSPLSNAVVDTVFFNGCNPGNSNSPPGETFALGTNHTNNMKILNCELDGRDPITRARTCSSLIGHNSSSNCYLEDTYAHHTLTGHGVTFWQCDTVHTVNMRCEYTGTASSGANVGYCINHENVSGTVLHESPSLLVDRAGGNSGYHMSLNNSSTQGYTNNPNVTVTNVTNDAGKDTACFSLLIKDTYGSSTQTQTSLPKLVTKAGVTLSARDANSGFTSPNPNTQYFRYH